MCGLDDVAVIDQPLDRVGDLVLVAPRRLDGVDGLEDVRVEHVDADQRQIAGRVFRLLDQPLNRAIGAQLGDAERGRIVDRLEDDLAVPVVVGEVADQVADAALNDVIAQKHDERVRRRGRAARF